VPATVHEVDSGSHGSGRCPFDRSLVKEEDEEEAEDDLEKQK